MADKVALYEKALGEIENKLEGLAEGNIVPRMATVAAVLKNTMPHYFWCGFYFAEEKELLIGPYQGTSACPNIAYSGVCGSAAKKKKTTIVQDVHAFPGHITCDIRAKSEIVVPLRDSQGRVIAVFDVDATKHGAFDEVDKKYLEQLMPLLLKGEIL